MPSRRSLRFLRSFGFSRPLSHQSLPSHNSNPQNNSSVRELFVLIAAFFMYCKTIAVRAVKNRPISATCLAAISTITASSAFAAKYNSGNVNYLPLQFFESFRSFSSAMVFPEPPVAAPRWEITPEELISRTEAVIAKSKSVDDTVGSLGDSATFESAILPYIWNENEENSVVNQLCFFQHVSTDQAVRDASSQADEKLSTYGIEAGLREDVFQSFSAVHSKIDDLKHSLDSESIRLVDKLFKQYKRNGLALPPAEREKVKALKTELSNLCIQFAKNLGEESGFLLFTPEELAGVPNDVLQQFERIPGSSDEPEKLKVTFKYPDLFPVLKYASVAATRRALFLADQNKVPENVALLTRAVELRSEIANLLGYGSHAAFVLENRMAKNPETVLGFLEDLKSKLKPRGLEEKDKMLKLKNDDLAARGLQPDQHYYVWDHRFYNNKLLETEYQVDAQKVSEFFPLQSTVEKMLSIFENLFSLKFVETPSDSPHYSVWHSDVQQFAVWRSGSESEPKSEPESEQFVGWLYFDLHPRNGKYGHAANFNLSPGFTTREGKRAHPVTALVCNFSKPTPGKPSLLKHDEVTTFFHELGHGIHDLMGQTRYARFHGTSVARDFVEAPSQMLEYWTWSPDELQRLSAHYETGEPLPREMCEKLVSTKHVNGALFNLRQLHFALFDMKLHTVAAPQEAAELDVAQLWNGMREEIALVENGGEITRGYASFGHLMGGYDAGYYGYLYSQVFAADMYASKFAANPLSSETGREYRDKVLARGGSRDEMDSLEDFLGRAVSSEAFLKELGVSE